MSKIGKQIIKLNGANITKNNTECIIKGQNGELVVKIPACVELSIDNEQAQFVLKDETYPNAKALWGLARALLNNAVKGVTEGFTKELELVGVGYRVEKTGNDLKILIGYSHPVIVRAPIGITFTVEGNTIIKVQGFDRQLVGQVAANIREIRKPEPYKGKGIKYKDEIVKRKQGKAAK